MRAVAITIGCGLALCAGLLTDVGAQNPPAQAPQTPPAAPAPPETIFERQWNHTVTYKSGPDGNPIVPEQIGIAAGKHRVFVSDNESGVEARAVIDGAPAWQAALPSDLPVAVAGAQIFVSSAKQIHALDEATGQVRWSRPVDSALVALIAHGAGALTASEYTVRSWSADGAVVWERTLAARVGRGLIAVDGTQVYVGLTNLTLVALDATAGTDRWIEQIGTLPRAFTATGGKLYFGGEDRRLHAYDRDGGRDWRYNREEVVGAPAVDDKHVYVALWDNTIVAHSKGGKIEWREGLEDRPAHGPILSGDRIATILRSDRIVTMPLKPGKPAAVRGGPPAPARAGAPAEAPAVERSRSQVFAATPSVDGSQIFAVIQLENRVRIVVAYKRT